MYWKMYADYRKEHIITTGMCTPRLAEIAHCEIRNLQYCMYVVFNVVCNVVCTLDFVLLCKGISKNKAERDIRSRKQEIESKKQRAG